MWLVCVIYHGYHAVYIRDALIIRNVSFIFITESRIHGKNTKVRASTYKNDADA